MKKKGFTIFLFRIIPKALLSRFFGHIARIRFPKLILNKVIKWFCKKYHVNTAEIAYPEDGFQNMDQFFTRKLLPGIHKIDEKVLSVVSPVDGKILRFGEITGTRILQAKYIDYLIPDLVQADIHHSFLDGMYMTIYLCPADYHRIHSPVNGLITGLSYVPGKLFSVQEYMVNGLPGLFSINERINTFIQTPYGKCLVCKIGAMNVGKISVGYDNIISNKHMFRRKKVINYSKEFQPQIHKGDELGIFHLGSTVILLFEKGMLKFSNFKKGSLIRMGESIGTLNLPDQ